MSSRRESAFRSQPATHPANPGASLKLLAIIPALTLLTGTLTAQQQPAPDAHIPQPLTPAKTKRIVLAGDSTVNHSTGWGSAFCDALPGEVECLIMAKNGRSSKSFYDGGWWTRALDLHPQYILIQFGANDTRGKGPDRETDPDTTFAANLRRYITEARAANAIPLLVTPLPSRNYDGNGQYTPDLTAYAAATRRVGTETHTPVLDLNAEAATLLAGMTQSQADALDYNDPIKPAGTLDQKPDRVHVNPEGAKLFGNLVAHDFFREVPALSQKNKAR